ncbi:MAG: hypothetical protein KUG81_06035 [Gammaproteobacteria bacterium]|nr:hypothetical protein [Gammaproteobacteria bacterium]
MEAVRTREDHLRALKRAVDDHKKTGSAQSKKAIKSITQVLNELPKPQVPPQDLSVSEVPQLPTEKPVMAKEGRTFGGILQEGVSDVRSLMDSDDPLYQARPGTKAAMIGAKGVQTVASIGGEAFMRGVDTVVEAAKPLASKVSKYIEEMVPVEAQNAFQKRAKELYQNPKVQEGIYLAGAGLDKYQEWAKRNPKTANELGAVVDLSLMGLPPTPFKNKGTIPFLENLSGTRAKEAGEYLFNINLVDRKYFSDNIYGPVVETGRLSPHSVQINDRAKGIAEELGKLETITEPAGGVRLKFRPNRNYTYNQEVVSNNIGKEAEKLQMYLRGRYGEKEYNTERLLGRFTSIVDRIDAGEPPFVLSEDLSKKANNAIRLALRTLDNQENKSLSSLLTARQEFDKVIKTELGDATLDSQKAASSLLREIRSALNEEIFEETGTSLVKDSLAKQTKLYGALDIISDKADLESVGAFGRLLNSFGMSPTSTPLAAIASVGAVSGAATALSSSASAGYVALATAFGVAGGAGAWKAFRALTPNQARDAVGDMVKTVNSKLKDVGSEDILSKQLKADRMLLIDILNNIPKESSAPAEQPRDRDRSFE